MKTYTYTLINDFKELNKIKQFISQIGKTHNLQQKIILHIQLAVEELLVNIISYAYKNNTQHKIQLTINLQKETAAFCLVDDGKPFNPMMYKTPNIHKNSDKQTPGNLGILLAKNLMDEMSYSYQKGFNQLTFIKKLH